MEQLDIICEHSMNMLNLFILCMHGITQTHTERAVVGAVCQVLLTPAEPVPYRPQIGVPGKEMFIELCIMESLYMFICLYIHI